jgi:hypothetical protein
MEITGQSIRTEPIGLGINPNSYHKTTIQRYINARNSGGKSYKSTYDREVKNSREQPALSITETLFRTVADSPRDTEYSNGIFSAPLISGLASIPRGSKDRLIKNLEGANILKRNTSIMQRHTPQMLHI